MPHFLNSPAAPPEIRNQQVDGSSPFAGSSFRINKLTAVFRRLFRGCFGQQGAYQGAYSWFRRLISGSPIDRLPRPDDLSTEERTAEFTRRVRARADQR